jgi:acetyl-CoA acyltransferase
LVFAQDEHPRATTIEALAKLKGRGARGRQRHRRQRLGRQRRRLRLLLANAEAVQQHGLTPRRASSAWPPPASRRA